MRLDIVYTVLIITSCWLMLVNDAYCADPTSSVYFTLETEEGITGECEIIFGESWSNFFCVDDISDSVILNSGWQILIKPQNAEWQCPFPLSPRGDLLFADVPSKGSVLLKLPLGETAKVKNAYLTSSGQNIEFVTISAVDAARFQFEGKEIPFEFSDNAIPLIDTWTSQSDIRSILAFDSKTNQVEALMKAAWVVSRMLEHFKNEHDRYPILLCELYKSENAVVTSVPLNPFNAEQTLCESILAPIKPEGYVKYYPETIKDESGVERIVGYWLAVVAPGEKVEPIKPLPNGRETPVRAIHWFESHPDS